MRPVLSLCIYAGAVFLGGALLAPWLAWCVQSLAGHLPGFHRLANYPFHLYVSRALLGLALIGIWPLLRGLGVSSFRDVGLVRPTGQGYNFSCGFFLGFASLAGIGVVALAASAREVNAGVTAGRLLERVSSAALTATTVAVLEEILFRGAIFGAMRKAFRWPIAVVISSSVYAIVHFFSQPPAPAEIHWSSGLEVLPTMLGGFVNVEQIVPGFFNLTLAGALLALAYHYTGNLYFSIGLHAGWIFWRKSYGFLTHEAPNANAWFWGTGKLIDGWLALIVLALVSCLVLKLRRHAKIDAVQPAP
jgi:membrane protease YdiL (CAAX protease family)